MARLLGSATAKATAMVGGVAKTIIQMVAPANQIVAITGYGIGGRGVSNTQQPGLVELVVQTTAGTATPLTPRHKKTSQPEAIQTTAQSVFTIEPTTTDDVRAHTVHPQTDLEIRDGFGAEVEIGGGDRVAMRGTWADAQTVDAYIDFEE